MSDDRGDPPLPLRLIGQFATGLVARYPSSWRFVRGPMRRMFDAQAASWEERVNASDPERMQPVFAALEAAGSPEPRRALELGTGTGAGAVTLARAYPALEVVGVDLSPAMVQASEEILDPALRGRVSFEVADAAELEFADGEFDLVLQISVPPFFAETARVLAPGGHVIVVSSIGSRTPIHTPRSVLSSGFENAGVETIGSGKAGRGTWWLGRRR